MVTDFASSFRASRTSRSTSFLQSFVCTLFLAASLSVFATPTQLNWDTQTWTPEGPTNLSETLPVGTQNVIVTVGGNTAELDNAGTPISPSINSQNTGGLNPVENGLYIGTDYTSTTQNEVTITLDFSQYPGGVSNIDLTMFDIDNGSTFVDEAEVTAVNGTGTINPTTMTPGPSNAVIDANSIQGTAGSGSTESLANAGFAFAQSGITSVTIVYRNNIGTTNPGFQWMNIHDISFDVADSIGIAKQVSTAPVNNGDGSYTFAYTMTVENTGATNLTNVQVIDDLAATFSGASFVVDAINSADFATNGGYNGTSNTDVLAGSDSLAVGASGTLELVVTVTPGANLGPYNNSAVVNANDPGGSPVTDDSTDGTNVDPNGNGDPTDDTSPTPVSFVEAPEIGTAKQVSSAPVNNGNGTYTFTYSVLIENTGDVPLNNVQLVDNLSSTFAGATFAVDSVTSTDFATNAGFNGAGNTNVLAGTDTLVAGASGTVAFTVTVTPAGNLGPYNNTAVADGDSPGGTNVTDDSADGVDVDPNGNGNPGDDSTPTPVLFAEAPEIGTAKAVSSAPVNNGDGSYTLTYTILVGNTGDVPLANIQVVDNLATTFAGATFAVNSVTSTDFATNAGFNGGANTNVLAGTDTLAAGANGTVDVTVTVTPGANLGPYDNAAVAAGDSPGGTNVTDTSTDGANVDPNGNGDPGDDSTPTPISFAETPEIGTAKQVSSTPVNNGNGTYTLTYSILVENTGDVALSNVQVVDNLATTFAGATFAVDSVTSTDFATNAGFNGGANTNVLAGTDSLAIGASGTVDITVTLTPGGNLGPYENSAVADGDSPGGTNVTDTSADGADVDPNGNGDPSDDTAPTPVIFEETPEIGTAKAVSSAPVNNGDGTYTLTYTVLVENTGDVPLSNVQVVDNLATTFAGISFVVDSVSSADFNANAGFNGAGNTNVLAGTDSLAIGSNGTVDITVTVTPAGNLGPYNNLAVADGDSPGGTNVTDTSTDGADVDPNGNGNPGDDMTPTPVSFTESPQIGTAKQVGSAPTNNGDGTYTMTYAILVENTGDVPLNNVQVVDNLTATFSGASFVVDSVTSVDFATNAGFNGTSNTNVLAGTDTLAVSANGTVNVTLIVTPGSNLGPYNNTAVADGDSAGGTNVTDNSTDGADVDPNGNGNPGDDSAPTPVTFAETPQIGTAKEVSTGPTSNGDGTYSLTYTVLVENTGDVPLTAVQVADSLATTFSGATFAVNSVTSADFATNAGFNGSGNSNLLAGTDALAVGASGTVDVAITVTPGSNLGPYNNTAVANGASPSGTNVTDTSADGADVDPNGNGDPGDDNAPTPVSFAETPEIGTAKQVTSVPANNGDGSYTMAYTILVENTGDVTLNNVQVVDNLATTFAGATFVVDSVSSADFVTNAGFNGIGDTNVLTGADSLAVSTSGSVVVTITITPGANLGPYTNTAVADGDSPSGTNVTDDSTDGADVDPNGNGDPGDDATPTPVSFAETPEIGTAKQVTNGPISNGDGSFTITYTVLVENTGDVPLSSVQVVDDLSTTFATATSFVVNSLSSADFAVDLGFDGSANTNILAGTDTLAVGASGTMAITVTITPGAALGPYNNTATADGDSPSGTNVTDDSTDGADVDPNGNGDPGDDTTPTPVSFVEDPEIGLAKSVSSSPVNNGDGTFTFAYTLLVDNTGDVPLDSIQVVDDLSVTFALATGFTVDSVVSSDFTVSGTYDGAADTDLLVGGDVLAAGANGTVNVTVTVEPGGNLGPYNNSATTAGKAPSGVGVTDTSQLGANVDPDSDGDPSNNSAPTPISFNEAPEIGVAKVLNAPPTSNGDGSFTLSYDIRVENTGDVDLSSLQVVEDFDTTFASASSYTVDSVTSATLSVSATFDGSANTNLLDGSDVLVVAANATITVTVTVVPGADLGPYNNMATGEGTSPGGTPVSDDSTDGTNVDPNGNGNPADDNTPTPVMFAEMPEIGVAKAVTTGPTNNGDGSYSLTYTFTVANTGDVDLSGVQVVDALSATFAGATSFAVNGSTSPDFALNASYNGTGNNNLLTGVNTLSAGATGVITLSVTVQPGANFGPYDNTATADGDSPSGTNVTDVSADGANVDPNGNGDPTDDSTPTPVTFGEVPEIGIAKAVTTGPASNGDGTATLTYTLLVENTGDVSLSNLQVTENLAATFGAATSFSVDSATSGTLTVNPAFDGSGTTNLLAGTDGLAVGGNATILITVTVEPGGTLGPYDNTATVAGDSPGGTNVTDDSTDGADVDPNGNGDPGDDSTPTPVTFAEMPQVGIAKTVSSAPVSNGDGSATLTYTLTVQNSGDTVLNTVQITDDLAATFALPASFTVDSITSGTLTTSGSYDGSGDINLLSGADVLAIGASATLDITVTVTPGANLGPYLNTANASGQSPSGMAANDVSQDGTVPDGNGNGDPTDDSDPTPVSFVEMPSIGLAKSVSTAPINNGDGSFTLTYTLTVDNLGDVDLSTVQVVDDLSVTYAAATSFTVDSVASGDFAVNAGFNGASDTNLLIGTDTLMTSATGTIDITLTVIPGANLGPYTNTADASGQSPGGMGTMDTSQSGANADPDGDGNPGNNSEPTPVSFNEAPELGVAKRLTASPVSNGDGTFSLSYEVLVANTGDVNLSNVQVVEDFDTTFALATGYVVDSVTSTDFTVNAGFDGSADTNLLSGVDVLNIASSGTVLITVTVTPGSNLGPYENTVTGAGTSPVGTPVTDDSTDGADVDPNGNGNPADDNTPTPVNFAEMPQIGVAKAVTAGPIDNGDGTSTLTYTVVVENTGDVDLNSVQVADDLAASFGAANTFVVNSIISSDFAVNTSFNGVVDTNMLLATDSLVVGVAGTIDLTLTVTPGNNLGPYDNTAVGTAQSPVGTPVTDDSTDGADVDPDADDDPTNNSVPTPITFAEAPQLGVAKSITSGPTDNGDGTFTLTYGIIVANSGNVQIDNLQVTDDLATTFAGATSVVVDGVSSADFTVNAGFDGSGDTNLLDATDSLSVAISGAIDVMVTVTPGANLGPYNNTATGSGASPSGAPVSDVSQSGANVDPDADGDPSNNSDPTPVSFSESPEIATSKAVSSAPVNNGDGTFTLTYTIAVENTGDVPLSVTQISDDLGTTYAAATSFAVDAVISSDFSVNLNYDGTTDTNLLAGTDTLVLSAGGSVDVTVTVEPGANFGPYDNSATGSGSSPSGTPVSDVSQSGTDPDPDGDDNPSNNSDPTSILFGENPSLGTTKEVSAAPVSNGDGTFTLTYTISLTNVGDVSLSSVQAADDMAATFAGTTSVVINTVASADFTANAGYDGSTDTNLLTGTDVLAVGGSGSVDVTVTVDPETADGPFDNTAVGNGVSPSGAPVTDASTDGADPDPDGDGDPGNNNVPTPVSFGENPVLGVAKSVSSEPVANADGTATMAYDIIVFNTGDVPLDSLQVTDSLASTFAGVTAITVDSVSSAEFSINAAYDGDADANLLDGSDTLAINTSGMITVTLTVASGGVTGPFDNTATASGDTPGGTTVTDDSTAGANADPDSDGDPTNNSDPTPVTLPMPLAALEGSAWLDADVDDAFDSTEMPLDGWIIEVVQDGVVVQTVNVNPDGSYVVSGLIPGTYDILLRNPTNMATFGIIKDVSLPPGTTVLDQNLPIDPSGIVYDSDTRDPIAGALVTMVDQNGAALPAACLLPDQQNQVTDDSGAYRFDVNLGATAACASGATYTIVVTSPSPYLDAPSLVIAPQAGPLVATGGGNPFLVAPQPTAPQVGESTVYYFTFMLSNGDPDIVNNHIPLDPPAGTADVRLAKSSSKRQVVVGELVPYTLVAENIGALPVSGLTISDRMPPGFSYVENSARIEGAGSLVATPNGPVVDFEGIDIPVAGSTTITYILRVGAGVVQGDYINRATPLLNGAAVGNEATARVAVISDPDFEQTTIIGIVFNDADGDGFQDAGEGGIPGVRLGTVEGLLVETDSNGRYHLAGIDGGRFDRGRNFIIKVDPATLPDGSVFSTENPRVKRITQGLINEFDFGVQLPGQQATRSERISVKLGEVFFAENSAEISPEFMPMLDQLADRLTEHGGGKLIIAGNDTPCGVSAPAAAQATEQVLSYTLTPRFGVRKANLQAADRAELDRIASEWVGASNVRIVSTGHTSNVRIAPQNRREFKNNYELSEARAAAVASYVGQVMSLSAGQVTVSGRGPDRPVASNSTASGRAKNRRVELQVFGSRGSAVAQAQAANDCSLGLAEQRARNVLKALEKRLGSDMMNCNCIDIQIGETQPPASDAETQTETEIKHQPSASIYPVSPMPFAISEEAVSQRNTMDKMTLGAKLRPMIRRSATAIMGLLVTTAHAAQLPACTLDSCQTENGYAIQIETYTDDRPMSASDSPVALANGNRADISGEFLIRLPGGGKMWATEDPAVVDPRMAVHSHEALPVTAGAVTEPVDFYIYKNYDPFISKAELLIFHEDDIDRIAPIATLPVGKGDFVKVQWNGRSARRIQANDQLTYIVQAFGKGGLRDYTREKTITAIRSIDYTGPKADTISRLASAAELSPMAKSAASVPMNGKLLVLQPSTEGQTEMASQAYRLTPHFDTRKTTLKSEDRAELDKIIQSWNGSGNVRIFAEGHTDNVRIAPQHRNEFANNQVLSEARAREVALYIANGLGVSTDVIQAVGYGPKQPVASNDTSTGRAQNRRVEVTLSGDRTVRRAAQIPGSMELMDPATRSSVPITGSLNDALNQLNRKVDIGGQLFSAPQSGRSAGMSCAATQNAGHEVHAIYGRNELARQNISMYGSRVRLHGEDISNSSAMAVNGNAIPIDAKGKFVVDYMMPVGQHAMNVEFMDQNCTVVDEGKLGVNVSGHHMFIVALADFTASDSNISGSIEPLSVDDRFDGDFLAEGRLAFYLKGKVRGKYLLTAQLDTKEEELSDLFSNLGDKDPSSIFRRLDPDRYYPVYGDDSTTIADTDSIGKMYVRADWDKSRAVWGNFHTGFTGSEFTQYNRSLYGGQFDWHSKRANMNGDSKTDLNVFVSENQTELGHSEFRGTGGSLYYLRHTDLLPGSEKMHVEIRDRDSARVLENITLMRGVDYEIDELQGRLLLTRPLMQITQIQGPTLIKDAPLDGNDVILLADYEYIPSSFSADHTSVGARGKHWFGDHFALGGTYVSEGRGDTEADYTMMGAEMVLQMTPHSYLKAEVVQTEQSQSQRFFSNNGGLNFEQVGGMSDNRDGEAVGLEARINTKEWWGTQNEWVMAGWYRNSDADFSIARRDNGYEVTESGAEIVGNFGEKWKLAARASMVERDTLGDDESFGIQLDYTLSSRSVLAAEVRSIKEERPSQNIDGTGTIGALRYTRRLGQRWEAYVQGQFTLANDDGAYDNNDLATVGVVAKINERTNLIAEYSSGHRGDGAALSLDYEINPRHRVYGSYTHSADRTDSLANDQIAIGHRSTLSDQLTVFNEHQFSEYRDYAGIQHVFGLEFSPRPGWSLGASYQTGELETADGLIDRDSVSGTLAYQGNKVRMSTKLEFRNDSGQLEQDQWVTANRIDYKLSEQARFLGRFNHSETEADNDVDGENHARFTEAQVGMAYRPLYDGRLNLLAKYTYLYDLRAFDQILTGPDQRSNVFSVEGLYQVSPRWNVGGKYAYRTGELRTDRDQGDWFESTTSFYALRGRYHLISAWDAMAEYRWLDVDEAGSTRNGWLLAVDRHFGNHMKLGLGYNFTDYSDDLTNLDYDQKGWFLNALGKY